MIYKTLEETSEVGVSHNPLIKKKVLISKGQISHLTQFSKVWFPPGEVIQAHTHPDMFEIYSVESGEGVMVIAGKKYTLTAGVFVTVEPGEKHEAINTGKKDLLMTMVGISVS